MRRRTAALAAIVVAAAGITAQAGASGARPAGILTARPAVAAVPAEHTARVTAPVPVYRTPGGEVLGRFEPGPVFRTGETVRDESGRWHEVISPYGLGWMRTGQ